MKQTSRLAIEALYTTNALSRGSLVKQCGKVSVAMSDAFDPGYLVFAHKP
jgi:hypothetical protein